MMFGMMKTMSRNSRRKYKAGERTYIVDFNSKDVKGYLKAVDEDTEVEFFLPQYVVEDMKYVFNWNRFHEELDINKSNKTLNAQLLKLERPDKTKNILNGIKDMKKFIKFNEELVLS